LANRDVKLRVLFLTKYPVSKPSTRFRVMQYLPYLETAGIRCTVAPPMPESLYNRLYRGRGIVTRLLFHLAEIVGRMLSLLRVFNHDIIFVQKGLLSLPIKGIDVLLMMTGKPFIYDFDDAVHLFPASSFVKFPLHVLDNPNEVIRIIRRARVVIAGNRFLERDVTGRARRVTVIPTCVDLRQVPLRPPCRQNGPVTILWSGNRSGYDELNRCFSFLRQLWMTHRSRVMILSDTHEGIHPGFWDIDAGFIPWSVENERKAFQTADIGIMYLYDTLWNRRKCAFKALLYMANGIPAVVSPVGIATDIVRDGENGLLAADDAEWFGKIERLVCDRDLRERIGAAGRTTVERDFSLERWAPLWVGQVRQAARRDHD